MSKLGPVSRRELVRRLRRAGFEGPYQQEKHGFMVRGALRLTLPNPHGGEIGVDLLAKVLRQAGISKEEWEKTGE